MYSFIEMLCVFLFNIPGALASGDVGLLFGWAFSLKYFKLPFDLMRSWLCLDTHFLDVGAQFILVCLDLMTDRPLNLLLLVSYN